MHLFAYGTLMFPEVWDRVVGRGFTPAPATATGFAVYRVRNGLYPVLVRAVASQVVQGVVYRDLDAETIAALDAYESDFYERIAIDATLADGTTLTSQAYLLSSENLRHASEEPWDAADFKRNSLASYLRQLD
jgi:gamma-glutamylcyclotransferase (GGCT)/AIG2-like uncharacterized protein YtfP